MRLAPSFLFSLLMLMSVIWGQATATASVDGMEADGLLGIHYPIVTIDEAFLDELEEEDETEFAELTVHGGNSRQQPVWLAGEDRSSEMYWPPEQVVIQVLPIWAPPSSRTLVHRSPAPGQLLRPPRPAALA